MRSSGGDGDKIFLCGASEARITASVNFQNSEPTGMWLAGGGEARGVLAVREY